MNSFQISGHSENNTANINVSQCSGDLFQDSPQIEYNIHNSFTCDIEFSNEKSSGTSDELCFTPPRKPRRALGSSYDSSHYYSKKSSDSLQNDSNTDSSKFFQPISPACKIDKIGSTSFLKINQSNSPETFMTPRNHHLSKENVEVISFVSESEHSSSSSILENSLISEDNNQNSKQIFKTPICSSVKKRTIRQWLNSVSLNCSLKPNENSSYDRPESPSESNISKDKSDSERIGVNLCIESVDNASDETYNVKEFNVLNVLGTGNSTDSDSIEKNNTTENYCPWLFDSFENRINEFSMKPHEPCLIHKTHEHFNVIKDHNTCTSSQNSPDKSTSPKQFNKLVKTLNRSFHEGAERNITRANCSSIFNKRSQNYKSDDNKSSPDESDSSFNKICYRNSSKSVDSDDSFTRVKLFRKKKKKNCLNISSDDSEAKDTANESEDIPSHNNDLCTPRRRLYFRNPLNNSLDDDAKPLTICKDYSIGSKDNIIKIASVKSTAILDQIYSEINNTNDNPMLSVENDNESVDKCDSSQDAELDPALNNESSQSKGISFTQSTKEFNKSAGSVILEELSSIRQSSPENQDDVDQINFSSLSIGNTSQKNISTIENNVDIPLNTSDKDGIKSSSINERSQINEVLDSSYRLPSKLDESSDSVINIKRKSKKNILNFSSDNSFVSEKPSANIIDTSDNRPPPSIDLTKSDDEYDKYIYRTRSDSSFSDNNEIPDVSKDSSEVISVHTTTSEEEEEDGEAPWFDLESYLKKNIPASSKSLDSSFLKNSEKRNQRLAKISLPTHSSCPNHTSFLLSLTPEVPDEMCHPEAVKYRGESFSKHKNELVDLLFKLFNKEIFDEKLPALEIKWSGHLTTTSGITKSSSKITKNGKIRNSIIKLSKTVVNDASKVRDVLLHELCHAANWLIDEQSGGHGPLFKKWVNIIWIKFPEVPKVKTTHHYELNWKYLYKCSYCGYELGKMKLSLNETSCRLCGGLVTVNT